MSTETPAPNDDTPRQPSDPAAGRNDIGIDPDGSAPVGGETAAPAGGEPKDADTPAQPDADKAKDNSYSPDFAPEQDPDKKDPGVAKDADIDTDGG